MYREEEQKWTALAKMILLKEKVIVVHPDVQTQFPEIDFGAFGKKS